MYEMPLRLILFQSLPETAILVSLGLVLIGIKPKVNDILKVSIITSTASFFIRPLPLPPGVHILVQLPILIGFTAYFCRLKPGVSAVSSMLGLIGVTLAETIMNPVVSAITRVSLRQALSDPFWRIVFPIPEFVFMIAVVTFLARKEISLFNINEFMDLEQGKPYEQ